MINELRNGMYIVVDCNPLGNAWEHIISIVVELDFETFANLKFPVDFFSRASVINLKPQIGSDNDIYLHMSIRFNENCIVRNTKQAGRYGSEERGGGLPLSKGQNFQMLIAVHQNCFKVCNTVCPSRVS